MNPAQIPIPGIGGGSGTMALMLGAGTFLVVGVGVFAYFYLQSNELGGDPMDGFIEHAAAVVDDEDADALALLPYSDGPLMIKAAIYDKELLGGKGGYITPDGDRLYVDGQGNGKYSMGGVDVITAIDPTEHASAADPLKAYIAHKNNIGQWIKEDRKDNLIEAGEALKNLDDSITPAMDIPKSEGVSADGGFVSEVHQKAHEDGLSLKDAKAELEKAGLLHKIVDLAPPREAVIDEDTGEVNIEEATHVATDFSAAGELLPKKINTTDLQVQYEKAKQEGRDEEKLQEKLITGIVIGAAISGVMGLGFGLMMMFM